MDELVGRKLAPVEESERRKVYSLMSKVIHSLTFKYRDVMRNLTNEQKARLSKGELSRDEVFESLLGGARLSEADGVGDVATYQGDLLFGDDAVILVNNPDLKLEDVYELPPREEVPLELPEYLKGISSVEEALALLEERGRELSGEASSI